MSIPCEVRTKHPPSYLPSVMIWLEQARNSVMQRYSDWTRSRRINRSRRILESLPEHILHDIGFPAVVDRLPTTARKPSK